MKKARRPSPHKRWTPKELAHLDPEEFVFLVERAAETAERARYFEGTGYRYGERMPFNHAIQIITGTDRPSRARQQVKRYLGIGIASVEHASAYKLLWGVDIPKVARPFTRRETGRFFKLYKTGSVQGNFLNGGICSHKPKRRYTRLRVEIPCERRVAKKKAKKSLDSRSRTRRRK
jgi:hypothetical protein